MDIHANLKNYNSSIMKIGDTEISLNKEIFDKKHMAVVRVTDVRTPGLLLTCYKKKYPEADGVSDISDVTMGDIMENNPLPTYVIFG
jgi:hypothetical protein